LRVSRYLLSDILLYIFPLKNISLSSTSLWVFRATAPTLWAFRARITQTSDTLNLYKVPHVKKTMDLYKVTGNQENCTALALDKVDITHITEKRTSRYIIPLGWVLTDLSHMQRPGEHHHPFQRNAPRNKYVKRHSSNPRTTRRCHATQNKPQS